MSKALLFLGIILLYCSSLCAQSYIVGLRSGIGLWHLPEETSDPNFYTKKSGRVSIWEKEVFGRMDLHRFAFELTLAHRSATHESWQLPGDFNRYYILSSKHENNFSFSLGIQHRLPALGIKGLHHYAGLRIGYVKILQDGTTKAYTRFNGGNLTDEQPIVIRRHDAGLGAEYLAYYDLGSRISLQSLVAYRANWSHSLLSHGFIGQLGLGYRL